MSFGQQKSSSTQTRGLLSPQHSYFSGLTPDLFTGVEGTSRGARDDPGGLEFMPTVDQLLPVGEYGLPPGAVAGAKQLGRDMFSSASGQRAARGGFSPENLEGVAGDAIRMAAPQLLPYSMQYALQRAAMAPSLRRASFGYAMTPMEVVSNLLAGSGEGRSSSSGFGFSLSDMSPSGVFGGMAQRGLAKAIPFLA